MQGWVRAAEAVATNVTTSCDKCGGSGVYTWVNSHGQQSGPCFRCGGDGELTDDDRRRNFGYWKNR
jgi:DnaJ-class molecular chaperone